MPPYVLKDFYFKEARRLRYVARSAFKLKEIQEKFNIIRQGGSVLDLGSAPGAWLQVACESLGARQQGGLIVGIDIRKFSVPVDHCDDRVQSIISDVHKINNSCLTKLSPKGYSTILSDMCPSTSGHDSTDVALSLALGNRALELAAGNRFFEFEFEFETISNDSDTIPPFSNSKNPPLMQSDGNFVVKVLEGEGINEYVKHCRKLFQCVKHFKPKSSRSASREIYIIAKRFKF